MSKGNLLVVGLVILAVAIISILVFSIVKDGKENNVITQIQENTIQKQEAQNQLENNVMEKGTTMVNTMNGVQEQEMNATTDLPEDGLINQTIY